MLSWTWGGLAPLDYAPEVLIDTTDATIAFFSNTNTGTAVTFHWLQVPTGFSADVVASALGAGLDCTMAAWRVTGLQSTTLRDADVQPPEGMSSMPDPSGTVTVPAGGVVFGSTIATSGVDRDILWTGLVEDADLIVNENGGENHGFAHGTFLAGGTVTVSVTSTPNENNRIRLVAFR